MTQKEKNKPAQPKYTNGDQQKAERAAHAALAQRALDKLAQPSMQARAVPIEEHIQRLAELGIVIDLQSLQLHQEDISIAPMRDVAADLAQFEATIAGLSEADGKRHAMQVATHIHQLGLLGLRVTLQDGTELPKRAAPAPEAEQAAQSKPKPTYKEVLERWRAEQKAHRSRRIKLKDICAEMGANYASVVALKSRYGKRKR